MNVWLQSLEMHEILVYGLAFGLPIGVIASSSVATVVKAIIRHRERMAMIEAELDPDSYFELHQDLEASASRPLGLDVTQSYVQPPGGSHVRKVAS